MRKKNFHFYFIKNSTKTAEIDEIELRKIIIKKYYKGNVTRFRYKYIVHTHEHQSAITPLFSVKFMHL